MEVEHESTGVDKIIEDVPQGPLNPEKAIKTANDNLRLVQRRRFANAAGVMAVLQVVCADAVFIAYASIGVNWKIPTPAILGWLAATVVQVIGVVLVITRSLFPTGRRPSDEHID
jgi:hypothetical protein